MPLAARVGDPTAHPGAISGPGVPTVLIGFRPAAAAGDVHSCGQPHPPTPLARGSTTVFVGGRPALRQGDVAGCGAAIVFGEPTVLIGG
jgi:uncharacterized Zn-binding protein involved in type VI secretion